MIRIKKLFCLLIPSLLWARPNGAIQVSISKKDPHLYLVPELYPGGDEDTCFAGLKGNIFNKFSSYQTCLADHQKQDLEHLFRSAVDYWFAEDNKTSFIQPSISCRYDYLGSGAERKSVKCQYGDGTEFEVYALYNLPD